ncbi:MAG: FecR domain-containing protein [Prolixibacteraceae bacterium]|jgi:transmembrane sensor|nr:FecR domain-containing protein [Prolixibacteraceae bacterium]
MVRVKQLSGVVIKKRVRNHIDVTNYLKRAMQENYDIIAKYLAGEELSDEEKAMIKKAKADPVSWSEIKTLFRNSGQALKFRHLNAAKAWEIVDSKTGTKSYRNRPIAGWLKYAATIVLMVTSTLLVWQLVFPDKYITYNTESSDLSRPEYLLADGTKVTLNHGTTLKTPRKFSNNNRTVYFEGEAFFEVAPDAARPFIVKAGDADVKVLGTSFNVRSYLNNANMEVAVETGRVEVASLVNKNTKQKIILAKNQKGIVIRGNGKIVKHDYYHKNDLAWFTRCLEFDAAPLAEVINVLNRTYHSKITADADVDTSQLITASFDRQNISYVLDVIAMTLNLNIHQQDENLFYIRNN